MYKRITIITAILGILSGYPGFAQDESKQAAADAYAALSQAPAVVDKPDYWDNSAILKVDFTNTSLSNWAAGGYMTATLKSFVDANANYKKDDTYWNNRLQLDYGFLYSADKPFLQKSDDRIYLESKFGYKAKNVKNLNYSAQFSFKSQFTNSWTYITPPIEDPTKQDWMDLRTLKSGPLSPANTTIALGIDWIPTKWLTVNFAPLTGGFVIVRNEELRAAYSMPVKDDGTFKGARFEFGAQVKVDAKVVINNNFNYTTQLLLFSDYLNKPQNIRVNWDNRFDWKVAKYFSFTITSYLIYDDNVLIKSDKDIDKYPNGRQRVQFKESLAFGFSYTLASKK